MSKGGVLTVHDNVVFEANAAVAYGGAVSLPFVSGAHPAVVVFCDHFFEG